MGRGGLYEAETIECYNDNSFWLFITFNKENAKITNIIFYTFLLSLSIEILQPIINSWRTSDITDIITNVIGGIVGYILYSLFKPFTRKILDCIRSR